MVEVLVAPPRFTFQRADTVHPSLRHTAHRPWPLPRSPWRWRQSWLDLAFIHQRADAAIIQARLPPGLRLQTFDGSAWVGIVPFRMARVGPRASGPLPLLPSFPELNLRTYVEHDGKPGVWFFSLDADSWPIVFGGRRFYRLPYFRADIRQSWSDGEMTFISTRREAPVSFHARIRPLGEICFAAPGSFEHWATERYCLYSARPDGTLLRLEVHHSPWPLRNAAATVDAADLLAAAGLAPVGSTAVCHFSPGVDVISFAAEKSGPLA